MRAFILQWPYSSSTTTTMEYLRTENHPVNFENILGVPTTSRLVIQYVDYNRCIVVRRLTRQNKKSHFRIQKINKAPSNAPSKAPTNELFGYDGHDLCFGLWWFWWYPVASAPSLKSGSAKNPTRRRGHGVHSASTTIYVNVRQQKVSFALRASARVRRIFEHI